MAYAFDIPAELVARHAAGLLIRDGALLRHAETGKIVAHLQEAAGLAARAGMTTNPVGMVASAAKAGLEGVQIVQNEQIKAGIALMQQMQVANLALTGVGIGVSVAGFALVLNRLAGIERQLEGISAVLADIKGAVDRMDAKLDRREVSALRTALRRVENAWRHPLEGAGEWPAIADELMRLEQIFADDLAALPDDPALLGQRLALVEAFAMAGNARTGALLAGGRDALAQEEAEKFATMLDELTGPLGTPQILRARLAAEGVAAESPAQLAALERWRPEAKQHAVLLREREAAAASLPLTIAALRAAGVPGRAWLQQAREREDAALLCLVVDDGVTDPVASVLQDSAVG